MINKIKLQSEATSLFDVRRWKFNVRCSVCSMLKRSMLSLFHVPCSMSDGHLSKIRAAPCLKDPPKKN